MSKERARAREARLAARRREVETAAAARERHARRAALRGQLKPSLPRRKRRFGQLSTLALVQLVLVFLAVQAVIWLLVPGVLARFALAVLTASFLLVLVRTRKRPAR